MAFCGSAAGLLAAAAGHLLLEAFISSKNGRKSGHRAPQKLSTKQSRSNKYAGADSEVEKASCEAWGVDFEDFELHGILTISV